MRGSCIFMQCLGTGRDWRVYRGATGGGATMETPPIGRGSGIFNLCCYIIQTITLMCTVIIKNVDIGTKNALLRAQYCA